MKNITLFIFLTFKVSIIFGANVEFNKSSCEILEENTKYSICILNDTGESLTGYIDEWILFRNSSSSSSLGSSIKYENWRAGKYISISIKDDFFNSYYNGNTSMPNTIYYEFDCMSFGWFNKSPPYTKTPIIRVTKENSTLMCSYLK